MMDAATDFAPAYRAWHCGSCDTELVSQGFEGDLACEVCGLVYRPDGDGHSAPCIDAGLDDDA